MVHRLTPFVIVHGPEFPEKAPREKLEIKMVDQPDTDISIIAKKAKDIRWIEPLDFHKRWQKRLLDFYKYVCLDISVQTAKKS